MPRTRSCMRQPVFCVSTLQGAGEGGQLWGGMTMRPSTEVMTLPREKLCSGLSSLPSNGLYETHKKERAVRR